MDVRRTAVVKLNVSDEQRDALHQTAEQYLYCANRTVDYCWSDASSTECKTNKRDVRDALYSDLREETQLQSQLVQAAIRRGVEAIKGVIERWKKGQRVSSPTFTAETMDYDTRSATLYRNKVSLATVEGRVEPSFVLPADSPTPYEQYVLSEDYELRESTLRYDAATDEFYLHISTRQCESDGDDAAVPTDTGHPDLTVLGIDLGVNSLAVSSTGTFWQGDDYDHTSQRCSRTECGFTHEDNRHGEQFHCQKCGYEVNADYNGAKNIGLRYVRKRTHRLRSSPKSGGGDASVDVRVNGGTLNGESHRPIAGD